jgi:hypothetical protein
VFRIKFFAKIFFDHLQPVFDVFVNVIIEQYRRCHSCRNPLLTSRGMLLFTLSLLTIIFVFWCTLRAVVIKCDVKLFSAYYFPQFFHTTK